MCGGVDGPGGPTITDNTQPHHERDDWHDAYVYPDDLDTSGPVQDDFYDQAPC